MAAHRIKVVLPIFADSRPKSVTIATSLDLSDREQNVILIMRTHMSTYPENLVKISPVNFETIGIQGSVKINNTESSISKT